MNASYINILIHNNGKISSGIDSKMNNQYHKNQSLLLDKVSKRTYVPNMLYPQTPV